MPPGREFIRLEDQCVLKRLEAPCLYDAGRDELYELSPDAFTFLLRCSQGERPGLGEKDQPFLRTCLEEGLVAFVDTPPERRFLVRPSPVPSLRYLELQITDRCNLRCRHCYLGERERRDLGFGQIEKVLTGFEEVQGLRLLLSGGEPLLHPRFWDVNEKLPGYAFRSVLLSNGTLLSRETVARLRVHEVQVSLDGMREGHDALRGEGTFDKAAQAIDHLREAGIRVSVATMIHRRNLGEFDRLASFLGSREIDEWNVDVPCVEGNLRAHPEFHVTPAEAAPLLGYGFGGGFHGSDGAGTCGRHLMAVLPDGTAAKCGLFSGDPVGSIGEGLRACWERVPRIAPERLACRCDVIEDCRGGCRFRAGSNGDLLAPDLYQCYARGVLPRVAGRDEGTHTGGT
jgi:radical SAM protein with 4Fe4S-binding SPASM domain